MLRRAAVAGTFYPGEQHRLEAMLARCVQTRTELLEARAIVVPHAGYMYSGAVAGATYGAVRLPHRFVILCPNHTGMGAPISIMSRGEWETPMGRVAVDSELALTLCEESAGIQESPQAHRDEHALEVHLPFLQHFLKGDFSFVPISVGTRRYESVFDLGGTIARSVERVQGPVLLISSSDMNHFESAELTEAKDRKAIDQILALDPQGLHRTVEEEHISMCGCGPTVAVLEACRRLGATRAELISYSHSGKVSGDFQSVVGYAGLAIC